MRLHRIHAYVLAAGLLGGGSIRAQTYEQVAPQTPPGPKQPAAGLPEPAAPAAPHPDGSVLAAHLNGIVLVGARDELVPAGRSDQGIVVESVAVLQSEQFKRQFQGYLGQPLTLGLVRKLTREIILDLRRHDRPVVDVVVPEQNISTGTLQLLVVESRLGTVKVEGNRWFATARLKGAVRARPGQVIVGSTLLEDVSWLNQNPFRQVDLVFARGAAPGETDVILRTTDRRPWRIYTGYEDSGNALTDFNRVEAGFNWGRVFGTDQQLNYQLTASPDFEQMVAHSGSYIVPLPWRHTLTVFGSHATSRPRLGNALFSLAGRSWQVSARYGVPLPVWREINQSFSAGADFKRSNNNLAFGGAQVFAQSTDVVQLVLDYAASRSDKHGSTAVDLQVALSPGGLSDRNKDAAFRPVRSFARADYVYTRLTVERTTKLPRGFSWLVRGIGQISSANLLGSEQLGFGGAESLRGYEEREANGDGGVIVVNELQAPGRRLGQGTPWAATLEPFVFCDLGLATIHEPLPKEADRLELASTGVGLRLRAGTHLSVRAAYGWQLRDSGVSDGRRTSRAHVAATLAW
jgi:hemolysin activation/secretion protein